MREFTRLTGSREGLCTVFVRHTSASLLIQENADPQVARDLEAFLARLVPEGDPLYRHVAEGPDDMPAHVRAALTRPRSRSRSWTARSRSEPGRASTCGSTGGGRARARWSCTWASEAYFATTTAGGFQVPSPGGRIEGGFSFGQ